MTTFADLRSQVESLYLAYLDRPGDTAGVDYWTSQLSSGAMTLAKVSASFAVDPTVKAALPFLSNATGAEVTSFVDQIYQHLFGHAADSAGQAYWTAQLTAGGNTPDAIGRVVVSMIAAADGTDGATIATKVDVHQMLGATLNNTFRFTGPLGNQYQPANAPLMVDNGQRSGPQTLYHIFDTDNVVVNGGAAYLQISPAGTGQRFDSGLPLWTTHLNLSGSAPTTFYQWNPGNFSQLTSIDASASTGGITVPGLVLSGLLIGGFLYSGRYGLLYGNTALTSFKGGPGADTLDLSDMTQLNGFTTLDGGAGRDTLILSASAQASLLAGSTPPPVGFEVFGIGAFGTIDMQRLGPAANGLLLTASTDLAVTNAPNGMTFDAGSFGGGVSFQGPAGANDVLQYTSSNASQGISSSGFETINMTLSPTPFGQGQGFLNFSATPTAGAMATANLVLNGSAIVISSWNIGSGTLNVSGTSQAGMALASITAGVLDAGSFASAPGALGLTVMQATSPITIIGSAAADTLTGSAGNDVIATMASGAGGRGTGDVLTGGAANDQFILRGDIAPSGALSSNYSRAANITDMTVGPVSKDSDFISLSAKASDYAVNVGTGGLQAAITLQGAETIQSVTAASGARAIANASNEIVKLASPVVTAGTLQDAFDQALGGSTITGAAANGSYFFTLYDSTNSRMIIGIVNDGNGTATTIEAGDSVALIGTANMTAAAYAYAGNYHFSIV